LLDAARLDPIYWRSLIGGTLDCFPASSWHSQETVPQQGFDGRMADNENMPKYTPRWRIRLWKLAFIAAALLAHAEWWPWWPWRILGLALLPIAFL
jgi:hypothetical protein